MSSYAPTSSTFNTFSVFLSTADYNAMTAGTPGVIYVDQQTAGQPQKRWDSVGQAFVSFGSAGGGAPITIAGGTAVGSTLTATIGAGWVNTSGGWARDGVRISGASALTYTTVSADLTHTVTYQSDSIPFYPVGVVVGVTVSPPTITTQPTGQSVTAPTTATFTISASANGGTLAYQWLKNGSAISGATSASYTTPATSTGDSGAAFTCAVSNSAGGVTSNVATLSVSAAAPVVTAPTIAAQPAAQAVQAPATATFAVTANANNGTLAYQWRKGGVVISGATSASYTTPATSTSDSGASFDCVVSNSAGSVTSAAVTLTVSAAAGGGVDSRPGWFAAPVNAATTGTAGYITARGILSGGTNGGKAGSAVVTTTGSNYAWFAVANSSAPSFTDGSFPGGFTLTGSPFVDSNSTTWYLYKSDYPASYSANTITLS